MKTLTMYQVDAFTDRIFGGNPAAVIITDQFLSDDRMQAIANENNLAETAFLVPEGKDYKLRWFTPDVEVDLCGHATLAAAYVLKKVLGKNQNPLRFHSKYKGILEVFDEGDRLYLNFPSDRLKEVDLRVKIRSAIGFEPVETFKGETDFIAVLKDEKSVASISPDIAKVAALGGRGLIVTAAGDKADFVSRFFAPQTGVDEDYVTGSAHTSLIPLWSKKINKKELLAHQISDRMGILYCRDKVNRVWIGGTATLFMRATIYIPN
tara:strand:- start:5804 stop:6598 length:795 start_codon:yes stop_codon:yes gene_type:complete